MKAALFEAHMLDLEQLRAVLMSRWPDQPQTLAFNELITAT
ncbi:hypothetical protein AB0392_11385 [Nonomuraea angiospora]